ncbi:oxidoreductase [Azoarcus sp. L1K30]|uniref:oxidoreductase n=1 Tax=Azoarcus sp. L1K30 TaxID=2820277 RepID=UPI001B818CC8|nr:oxidoreductase [Azoarcus sp. L1K30]MBR0568722.1 oxidoreductase [Azoarcus sp. L1K30]
MPRLALIGHGFAGRTFHAPLIRSTPGLDLSAVVTGQPDSVRAALPGIHPLATPAEAFADPTISAVVIATPNDTHAPLAEAAMRAGKHVVVDKPLALSLAQARQLRALADERGLILSVFQNRRWDSDFLGLRAALGSGLIGRLTHLESRFDRFRPEVPDRWRDRAPAGGLWLDLAPHLIDQMLLLFGLPRTVGGRIAAHRDGARADDWSQIQLDYGHFQVSLSASALVGGGMPRFAAHGTRGSWLKHGLDPQEDQLRAGQRPGDPGWGVDPRPARIFCGDMDGRPVPVPAGDYRRYYAGFRDALSGKGANPVPPAQAVATMAVLETAVDAAHAGAWLGLPLSTDEVNAFNEVRSPA